MDSGPDTMYDICAEAFKEDKLFAVVNKMKIYGFEESSLSWITSYISGRSQRVYVDGTLSEPLSVNTMWYTRICSWTIIIHFIHQWSSWVYSLSLINGWRFLWYKLFGLWTHLLLCRWLHFHRLWSRALWTLYFSTNNYATLGIWALGHGLTGEKNPFYKAYILANPNRIKMWTRFGG